MGLGYPVRLSLIDSPIRPHITALMGARNGLNGTADLACGYLLVEEIPSAIGTIYSRFR
jgi:hypothetical protein